MDVNWVGTKEMLADGFTWTLAGAALSDLRDKLHLRKGLWGSVVTYASCMHAWRPVQILWQMHGRHRQASQPLQHVQAT